MIHNRYSSPVIASDEDVDRSTESEPPWWEPENQLGLESWQQRRFQQDDEVVALDEGEIKYHEAVAKY
jgi:hypothetical protein